MTFDFSALVPWIMLFAGAVGAMFTINAFVPIRGRALFFVPSFFSSWLTSELALQHIAWQAIATGLLLHFGALSAWPGWLGLGITLVSWLGLLSLFRGGRKSAHTFEDALQKVPRPEKTDRVPKHHVVLPILARRSGIMTERDVVYRSVAGKRLKLDIVRPRGPEKNRPAIMQIHGGAWIIGDKREQGQPLIRHLAANGWVCFNVNYRLSPAATFPEHLIDLKYALKWIRDHADEYGVDPGFIAVTGGSAGGHLTAMMGLTANDPEYQPGFEDADTSVQAAIPVYGVYDFTNRLRSLMPTFRERVLEPMIMKAFLEEEPDKYRRASPMDRVHPDAPPFFVIHGDRDTLAPVKDARHFVEKLRETSKAPVYYAELLGAQHAFDIFFSPRTARMVDACLRFLNAVRGGYADERQEQPINRPAESPAPSDPLRT